MTADATIAAIETAVGASPDDAALRAHLVELLVDAGRIRDAVNHIDILLDADPAEPAVLRMAAAAHRALGDDTKANGYQRLADAVDPGDSTPTGRVDEQRPVEPRVAATPDGTTSEEIPDTADELLAGWADSEAMEEVEIGDLRRADATLADVGGLEAVKRQLDRSFLGPMRNPEMAAAFGKAAGGGLLLWGPPGCGKTFLARATAGEMGANFYNVGLADVLDMWIGASERNLAGIFDTARRNAPCVIFFDELDALGQKRSHLRTAGATLRGVVNQLLSELDGVDSDNDGIFVLGATNHPWDVDEALLRPGRFDRQLLVLPPDEPARDAILRLHLRNRPNAGLDLGAVVSSTEGYSGADLQLIVETATESALDRSLSADELSPITSDDLLVALASVQPSIGPWLETARNHVIYSNRSGNYDELETYLAGYDRRLRKKK